MLLNTPFSSPFLHDNRYYSPIPDDEKTLYFNKSETEKQKKWLQSFSSHARYSQIHWPINLQRLKKQWTGVEDDIESFIPAILADYS